jgi:hypothetical protein
MEGKMLINQFGDFPRPNPDGQVPYRPTPAPSPKPPEKP